MPAVVAAAMKTTHDPKVQAELVVVEPAVVVVEPLLVMAQLI
jgi:hypothetical protein